VTTDERIDRLTGVLEALAASVVARDNQIDAHDRQIGALIDLAAKHQKQLESLERQWQAYVNTLPRS
jgi:uncharacterized protein (DUF3084 family)